MIEIIPAIDIIDGKAVRLTKGDYHQKKIYDNDPLDVAKRFADAGVRRIHMVDLDGAKVSSPQNLYVLQKVSACMNIEIEWGGGIASQKDIDAVFESGATQAIIGSIAVKNQELFSKWLQIYGEKIILGADIKDEKIAIKGWLEKSVLSIDDLINIFQPLGLSSVICTDISKDGMLQGPQTKLYETLMKKYPLISFTASGGVGSMDDIIALNEIGVPKVIVGKAIYEKKISLNDIQRWSQNV